MKLLALRPSRVCGAIAVMVNRVRTARLAYAALRKRDCRTHLLIGRMRPIDRMALPADLDAMLSGNPRTQDGEPVFVVATQCLEVGADLDFDAIVTECASIDALCSDLDGWTGLATCINSARTRKDASWSPGRWRSRIIAMRLRGGTHKDVEWLKDSGDEADFGLCSETGDATVRERLQAAGDQGEGLRRDAPKAPVLLPAHLDALVQTSPRPALEPDVSLYLHGEENGLPEVQVVWRADLDTGKPQQWAEIVSLCPPVSTEAMAVPLREFRAWLTKSGDEGASASDIEGIGAEPGPKKVVSFDALCCAGEVTKAVRSKAPTGFALETR